MRRPSARRRVRLHLSEARPRQRRHRLRAGSLSDPTFDAPPYDLQREFVDHLRRPRHRRGRIGAPQFHAVHHPGRRTAEAAGSRTRAPRRRCRRIRERLHGGGHLLRDGLGRSRARTAVLRTKPADAVSRLAAAVSACLRAGDRRRAARLGADSASPVRGSAQDCARDCAALSATDSLTQLDPRFRHRARVAIAALRRQMIASRAAGAAQPGLGAACGPAGCDDHVTAPLGSRWSSLLMAYTLDPQIEHLLRRAGFGARPDELDTYPRAVVQRRGVDASSTTTAFPTMWTARSGQPGYVGITTRGRVLAAHESSPTRASAGCSGWCTRNRPLQEKMTLFWHNHFATGYTKIAGLVGAAEAARATWPRSRPRIPGSVRGQIEMLRDNALGNFRDLLVNVAKDTAMLFWLDGYTNTQGAAAGELRPRGHGAVHDGRRALHRARRVRGGARVHRLEPDAPGRRGRRLAALRVRLQRRTSTTRPRRRSASRSTPTAARRFRRAPRPAACRTASTSSSALAANPEDGALPRRRSCIGSSCPRPATCPTSFVDAMSSRLLRRAATT